MGTKYRRFVAFEGVWGPVYFNPGHVTHVSPATGIDTSTPDYSLVWTSSGRTLVKGNPDTIVMHLEEEL